MAETLIKELKEQRDERLVSGPAKRLMEKLKPIRSHVETYQKRWFWELLQNACDLNENVNIQIEITNDHLFFRHNGKPFSIKDATNLIFPDSGKDEIENISVIGQFGTGFLSTHIISPKVRISGILEDKYQNRYDFSFNLDRTELDDKGKLSEALVKSEQELFETKSLAEEKKKEYPTEFAYDLNAAYSFSDTSSTIRNGVKFIKSALPYVFSFVPQLQKVEICTSDTSYYFQRFNGNQNGCSYERTGEDPVKEDLEVVLGKLGNTQVAFAVKNGKAINSKEIPKLFCAYPMLGSEQFPFPCVINDPEFNPRTERDGVELSENDQKNRKIIEQAALAYSDLLRSLADQNIQEIYKACNLQTGAFEGKEQDWFKKNVSESLKKSILNNEVVKTESGQKKLVEVLIPYPENKETFNDFYSLCSKTSFIIPIVSEAEKWYETLNFAVFTENKLDIKELIKKITPPAKSLISEALKDKHTVFTWVGEMLNYILLFDHQVLLERHPLIPVKSGHYKTTKSELYWDSEIPKDLKDIHDLLYPNPCDVILLHSQVEFLGEKLWPVEKKKTEKDICLTIDQALSSSTLKITPQFIEALQKLFQWTEGMAEEVLRERFPFFSSSKAKLMLETLGTDKERNLAFDIIKSDKKEVLAKIAQSNISSETLEVLVGNEIDLKLFLEWKNSMVEDKEGASEDLGDVGERYLKDVLEKRFQGDSNIEVEWVAKTRREPNYDFEIRRNGRPWLFIDAKTTNRGISNSDTVPFFMRKGQWEFLPNLEKDQAYYIARIYIDEGKFIIKFLNIKPEEIN